MVGVLFEFVLLGLGPEGMGLNGFHILKLKNGMYQKLVFAGRTETVALLIFVSAAR